MIKLICFVTRRDGLDPDEFHARWRDEHAPTVAGHPATRGRLVGYELHRRKARDYDRTDTPYDGVAVQRYSSYADFLTMLGDPDYGALMAAEADLIDVGRSIVLFTAPERVVIDDPLPDGGTKLFAALHRRTGTSVEEFRAHWADGHAAVNRDTPSIARHILRYEQHQTLDDPDQGPDAFDGVTIQWFASTGEFFAMAGEPEYTTVIEPDERDLLDQARLTWILTDREHVVVG